MGFIIAVSVVFFDQLTKYFIRQNFSPNESVPLVKNIFHITLVYNRGAAFGIFKNQILIFIIAGVLAVFFILFDIHRNRQKKTFVYNLALGLVLGGAAGNLIDRLLLGCVVDFLDFRIWPVFNLADSAITVGVALLGCSMLKTGSKTIKPNVKTQNPNQSLKSK